MFFQIRGGSEGKATTIMATQASVKLQRTSDEVSKFLAIAMILRIVLIITKNPMLKRQRRASLCDLLRRAALERKK